jgi:hypothetical protein
VIVANNKFNKIRMKMKMKKIIQKVILNKIKKIDKGKTLKRNKIKREKMTVMKK